MRHRLHRLRCLARGLGPNPDINKSKRLVTPNHKAPFCTVLKVRTRSTLNPKLYTLNPKLKSEAREI